MKMPTDKSWYGKMAAKEGDHEISSGRRLTSTINPTPEEVAEFERLQFEALPQWARDRISQQDAELDRLREALKPFALAATIFEQEYGDRMKSDTGCHIKFAVLCQARDALRAKAEGENHG